MTTVVGVLLAGLGVYLGLGVLFAGAFVTWGVARIDPAARGAPGLFRILIVPGSAALWPVLLVKWIGAARAPAAAAPTTEHTP